MRTKDYRRTAIAVAIIAVCMMMSPIPANANMTIGNRYFNENESAIFNNSFKYGLSGWTVGKGLVTTSSAVYYDENAAIDFATGLNNDIVIEQLLDDKSTKNTGIIAFAEGKSVVFSFKFKTDYSYATAKAWIGTKSYDRFGVLRWFWNSCNPMPGKVSGEAAGSWVTVRYASWICPSAVYGLAVRIEILDTLYSAASTSSMDDVGVGTRYIVDPGDSGGHVNAGYVDDAQLAVAQEISAVSAGGARVSLLVMIRSVEKFSDGLDHAVIDIAFAADTSDYNPNYPSEITYVVIEVRMKPRGEQEGSVTVVEFGQSNNRGISVNPSNDGGCNAAVTAAGWVLGVVVGGLSAPVTLGASFAVGVAIGVAIAGSIDVTMNYIKESSASSDTYADGSYINYYTRTKLSVSVWDEVTLMSITNSIDWYYARENLGHYLEIYGGVHTYDMIGSVGITTCLYS